MTVSTNNPADVGSYPLKFTVCLITYPSLACLTKTFTVTILCKVQSMTYTQLPTNIFVEPGVTT